mgnify:FL=1
MSTQTDSRTYYEVLHVSRDAPVEIIRGSYRTMMQQLKHHPDLGGDTATAALINEAYAVLSDVERRTAYDARLALMDRIARGIPDTPQDESWAVNTQRILDPGRECVFCETPHGHGERVEPDVDCDTCGSPLSVAGNERIETVGQRAIERIGLRRQITFYTQWPQEHGFRGNMRDVSLHGMRFTTRQPLQRGQRIKIVSNIVEAVANVTHCLQQRRGWETFCVAGVSFVTLKFAQSVGGFVSDRV